MAGTKRRQFGNIVGHVKGVDNIVAVRMDRPPVRPDAELGRRGVDQECWGGKLILKGIQDVEDAKLAVNSGADALIVSNHGGRQLDGAESSIRALPAVGGRGGLARSRYMDGGVRSGQDVLKARSARRQGCLHRPCLHLPTWGPRAEAGVTKALEIIHKGWTSAWRCAAAPTSTPSTRASCPACTAGLRRFSSRAIRVQAQRRRHQPGSTGSCGWRWPRRPRPPARTAGRTPSRRVPQAQAPEQPRRQKAVVQALVGRQHLGGSGELLGLPEARRPVGLSHRNISCTGSRHAAARSGPPRHWRQIASAGPLQWPPAGRRPREVFR